MHLDELEKYLFVENKEMYLWRFDKVERYMQL